MKKELLIILVVLVVIIIILELVYVPYVAKYTIPCPNTYTIIKTKEYGPVLVYNTKTYQPTKEELEEYFTVEPKLLITQRFIRPITNSVQSLKTISKSTLTTDLFETFEPLMTITNKIIDQSSQYKLLTTNPKIKATTNEKYIYI